MSSAGRTMLGYLPDAWGSRWRPEGKRNGRCRHGARAKKVMSVLSFLAGSTSPITQWTTDQADVGANPLRICLAQPRHESVGVGVGQLLGLIERGQDAQHLN